MKILSENRKARHDYFIEETFEAGISLCGTEVKSIRKGALNLKDSFVSFHNGEAYIKNMHVSPYEQGNIFNRDPLRDRRLLLHKREIQYLYGAVKQKGFAVIPLSVYLKDSLVKVQIGLARGKKLYDKRNDIAERDAKRNMDRAIKEKNQ
ncbi:MAG: SsrA-binding protein SmpB [Ruminococcaceae bacterium]|nr:SsrA-binding protein SmpB [Oscillospiraceae bacterium]